MSSYRSAYENYYKNINNAEKGKKDKNKYFTRGKKADNSISSKYGINIKYNDTMINTLIKRIIKGINRSYNFIVIFCWIKIYSINSI